jgi:hypothetical protein
MVKKLPDKKELDVMWTVSTSSAIETGTRPHLIFARLLYNELSEEEFPYKLAD